jgi:hypothetical protein
MTASGVAPVAASVAKNPAEGMGHDVMATGKDINKNIRPAIAGLNRLLPSPPKLIFTTPIANAAPIATIYKGIPEGRLSANSNPVSAADRSHTVGRIFSTYFCNTHSSPTDALTDTIVTKSAVMPKKYTDTPQAGSRAMITSLIKRRVVTVSWMWGEGDIINFLSIYSKLFSITGDKISAFFLILIQ